MRQLSLARFQGFSMSSKITRKQFLKGAATMIAAGATLGPDAFRSAARADARGLNATWWENTKQGTNEWEIWNPAFNREIEGYASLTSVNRGGSISFYVHTTEPTYRFEIFRLGWYGGLGGRRMTAAVTRTGIRQAMPVANSLGMIECRWKTPYTITIPRTADASDWCSGYYVAKITGSGSGKSRYIPFVVRDDAREAFYLFQSSVTTNQAYNNWGGKSLYDFNSTGGRAMKVSFNRPDADGLGTGFVVNSWAGWELKTIRFLERESYDVCYCTNIDTHVNPSLLLTHSAFLSTGHDEYWSAAMRNNVETARNRGVCLAFLGSNTCYWQVRLETSPANGAANRTMVCYKENYLNDPVYKSTATRNQTTTLWRDPIVNRPEDAMMGVMYDYYPVDGDIVVENTAHWLYAGTGLTNGARLVGLLGYEADRMFGNAPTGTVRLANSPVVQDGVTVGASHMTLYTHSSGAIVFATGSSQWAFGLDGIFGGMDHPDRTNPAAQQMMRNLIDKFAVV